MPDFLNTRFFQIAETKIVKKILGAGRNITIPEHNHRIPGKSAGTIFLRMQGLSFGIIGPCPIMRSFEGKLI
jgi:hypothetical protein